MDNEKENQTAPTQEYPEAENNESIDNAEKTEENGVSKKEKKEKKQSKAIRVINEYRLKKEEDAAFNDIIFSEPISGVPEEKPQPLKRGNIDIWFFIWAMMLIFFGAVMSYSASAVYAQNQYDSSTYFLVRYIAFSAAAIAVTVPFVLFARPWFWRVFGAASYIVCIPLLLWVIVAGSTGGGAQRWIDLGFMTVQPSEIAKMAIVMVLALYLSKYEKEVNSRHKFGGNFKHGFLIPMLLIGFLCALIIIQPHLSGTIIVGMIGLIVMYLGGTRTKWLLIFLGIIAVAGVAFLLVFGYSVERVQIWLHIDQMDPLGDAWQTLQGLYAIGSGGFFGVGLGGSRQKFGYVSQPQNDFIFTIICEELGFVGAFFVILLFALLVWRGIKIGQRAPDKFCALTVWGLTFKIALQAAMNIAVVTNSMPTTGISLPFFSSGGTSLMLQIFEVGIILSISRFSAQKQ
ncbi:MAG: cell division protein FtsW [Clostridia bacterium]|nr:cell division protein FtsW [Clostridia bacterium]